MSTTSTARSRSRGTAPPPRRRTVASGLSGFAGVLLLVLGAFQALQGFAALVEDEFLVSVADYVFAFDVTAWGWAHLIVGVTVALAGAAVLSGALWGRVVAMAVAAASAVTQFLWLPYYPGWALLVIALDVAVIWALAVHDPDAA